MVWHRGDASSRGDSAEWSAIWKVRERDSDEIWLRDTVGNLVGPGERRPKEVRRSEFVQMGEGLLPMSRRLVDKIQSGEFVEFAEFPVLDGGARSMDQADQDMGDRVVVVQAQDRRRSKREVPCASMWGSCFMLYERAVLMVEPDKGLELSAYRETIQKAARTHQWEFVIKYDRQFRKAAAVDRSKCWARVDSSLFMQELAGPQAAFLAAGAWTPGRGSEYSGSRKRSRDSGSGGDSGGPDGRKGPGTYHKFNWQDGVCPYGIRCKFSHTCARCGGLHPSSRCNGPHMEWRSGQAGGSGPGPGQSVGGQHAWKGN